MPEQKSKTELEMQDFSWQNIIGWGIAIVILGIIYKATKKK